MSRIIALLIVVSSFFSCQKEIVESAPIPSEDRITFSVDSVSTRGSVITSSNISSMVTFCYTSAGVFDPTLLPNHMYKAEVQYTAGNEWVIQSASGNAIANTTWDGGAYHSFFSIAPYEIIADGNSIFSSPTTSGSPTLDYQIPQNPLDHKDLLYSSRIDAIDYDISNRPVNLKFKHALSKISFSASKSDYEAPGAVVEQVTVKAFNFSNIWNAATFTFEEGVSDEYIGVWDYTNSGPKVQDMETTIINGGINSNTLSSVMTNITTTNGVVMPLPQGFATEAVMTVVMDITKSVTIDGNLTTVTNEYIKQFPLETVSPQGWEMGKSYHYKFMYNGDGNLPSSVEVVMTNWNEEIVDGDISGTYLDVVNKVYVASDNIKIYYNTNSTEPIAWSGNSSGTITAGAGYLEYDPHSVGIDNITITAGNLSRTINLTSLGVDPSTVTPNPFTGDTYVGAFWKASETQERLIDMKHNNTSWTAKVLWIDGRWEPGDVVLDMNYPTTFPVNTVTPVDLTSTLGSVGGSGDIKFRIGLKSTYTPTSDYPARYALILVESGANKQFLYLRQGENPDYLMRQGESDENGNAVVNNRDYARQFAVYNLSALDLKNGTATGGTTATNSAQHPQLGASESAVFVDYPTQAGAYWQHMVQPSQFNNYGRRAYHPVNPATGAVGSWGSTGMAFTIYWNTLEATQKVSPSLPNLNGFSYNFRRPNDGTISGDNTAGAITASEMRQSLWVNPPSGGGVTNNDNITWGYYADGFFDRRTIGASEDASAYPNSTVAQGSQDVAYIGSVFFNPTTHASLFLPASGFRLYTNGTLTRTGSGGGYWTSTTRNSPNGWCFYPHKNTTTNVYTAGQFPAARGYGFAIRAVVHE